MDTWLHFPGFPPIKGIGEPIVGIEAANVDDDEMPIEDAIEAARKIGERNGKNAASWVFDGNTPIETYQTVLHGIYEGDPAVYDMYREPNLSGEYDYSERDLADEIGIDYISATSERELADEIGIEYISATVEEMGLIADAYLNAAQTAFWDELEHIARLQLG